MISFESDYIAGAHPQIIARLAETNMEILSGYGTDKYCESAKEKIRRACGCPTAQVELLIGGTQTNAVIISTMLKDYEGVVAAKTGHINVHEAGAIEYTNHKVLEIPHKNGKIVPNELKEYLDNFYLDANREHMVFPGMVYITHPTEYGTLYTKQELTQISELCHAYEIPLYLDGARLGYGLMSRQTDVTLTDVAALCDVFYIGGTKVGALCGEAVVFTKQNRPQYFMTSVKKRGALLAKGRLLGIQFDTLFTDDLYFKISRHGIDMAEKLKTVLHETNQRFYLETPTNQQFVIWEKKQSETIAKEVVFSFWENYDERHIVVRLATSWSTSEEEIYQLRTLLDRNSKN